MDTLNFGYAKAGQLSVEAALEQLLHTSQQKDGFNPLDLLREGSIDSQMISQGPTPEQIVMESIWQNVVSDRQHTSEAERVRDAAGAMEKHDTKALEKLLPLSYKEEEELKKEMEKRGWKVEHKHGFCRCIEGSRGSITFTPPAWEKQQKSIILGHHHGSKPDVTERGTHS